MSNYRIAKRACGTLAGIAGAAAMHAFRLLWESAAHDQPRHGIFGFDREADVNSARLMSSVVLRRTITDVEAEKLGLALHYGYGAAMGVFYEALNVRAPAAFGSVLWFVGDEIPISMLGLTDPSRRSVASHLAALGAHLLFGCVVDAVIRYPYRYEAVRRQ